MKNKISFELTDSQQRKYSEWKRKIDMRLALKQLEHENESVRDDRILEIIRKSISDGDPKPYYGVIGGAYSFIFTPTSLGVIIKVEHSGSGEILDLTDYHTF